MLRSLFLTQCPAVTACCLLTRTPPHFPLPTRINACHGKLPNPAGSPSWLSTRATSTSAINLIRSVCEHWKTLNYQNSSGWGYRSSTERIIDNSTVIDNILLELYGGNGKICYCWTQKIFLKFYQCQVDSMVFPEPSSNVWRSTTNTHKTFATPSNVALSGKFSNKKLNLFVEN